MATDAADVYMLAVANAIAARGAVISLHSATPGKTGANEITGGSPAYARVTGTWGSAALVVGGADDGKARIAMSTLNFNVPAGVTVTHFGVWLSGVFQYGKALAPGATLTAQGTIDVTPTHVYAL